LGRSESFETTEKNRAEDQWQSNSRRIHCVEPDSRSSLEDACH